MIRSGIYAHPPSCIVDLPGFAPPGRLGLTTIRVSCTGMAKTSSPSPTPAVTASYEDALDELERLVASMESGHLPLDHLLESYRRGAELLSFCRTRLEAVEQQVKVLEDGQLKAWNHP